MVVVRGRQAGSRGRNCIRGENGMQRVKAQRDEREQTMLVNNVMMLLLLLLHGPASQPAELETHGPLVVLHSINIY